MEYRILWLVDFNIEKNCMERAKLERNREMKIDFKKYVRIVDKCLLFCIPSTVIYLYIKLFHAITKKSSSPDKQNQSAIFLIMNSEFFSKLIMGFDCIVRMKVLCNSKTTISQCPGIKCPGISNIESTAILLIFFWKFPSTLFFIVLEFNYFFCIAGMVITLLILQKV